MLAEALSGTLYRHVRELFAGKVADVERRTTEGFTRGRLRIVPFGGAGEDLEISFQNENLVAEVNGRPLAIVPDLICVLEAETGEPITSETLRYGQRVLVVAISTPDIMRTPEALAVFGPRCFGLDHDFVPVERLAPVLVG